MTMRMVLRCVVVGVLVVGLASCAHLRWPWHWGGRQAEEPAAVQEPAAKAQTAQDYESELRDLVRGRIAAAKSADEQRTRVIHKKPYFFKAYEVYPSGADDLKVVLQKKESRSAPYIADVTVSMQRFATRLHPKYRQAEEDSNFLRDTGTETATYELRNGRWARLGSLFVAAKSEENVNGEWLPVKETVKRTIPKEEEKRQGFLRRTWYAITGH